MAITCVCAGEGEVVCMACIYIYRTTYAGYCRKSLIWITGSRGNGTLQAMVCVISVCFLATDHKFLSKGDSGGAGDGAWKSFSPPVSLLSNRNKKKPSDELSSKARPSVADATSLR